jgi:hypothetical protein
MGRMRLQASASSTLPDLGSAQAAMPSTTCRITKCRSSAVREAFSEAHVDYTGHPVNIRGINSQCTDLKHAMSAIKLARPVDNGNENKPQN